MASGKRVIYFISYLVLASAIFLIVIEVFTRTLFPQINYQGNPRSMFAENAFNQTMGLAPNSSGEFFGVKIYTDKHGFRKMNSPDSYDKSWVFLGDSVTFGVGIDTEKIFPQLIQNTYPRTRIWNTAVVGYSVQDYPDVINVLVQEHDDIEKVVIFFCLNDVYGNLSLNPGDMSAKEMLLSYLRSNSKLFLLLKKIFFDRSKTYAIYDTGLYKEGRLDIEERLNAITNIKSTLVQSNIDLLVVILPYEYQLRTRGLTEPQELLGSFFEKYGINYVDLFDEFIPLDSELYFLYGDPMHLSSLGHETVANKMIEILQKTGQP